MLLRNATLGVLFALTTAIAACSSSDHATTGDDDLNESKALGMTDVTVLYPTPPSMDFFDDMLGPSSEDAQGELFPADLYSELIKVDAPAMMAADGTLATTTTKVFAPFVDSFPMLRVVGIRLDPCFGESFDLGSASCTNTIRMTAQFFINQNGSVTPDGRVAIHLFYKISRSDFTALAQGMLDLRKASGLPLQKGLFLAQNRGVHPTLMKEGLRGDYANGLKALMLKYAGARTLSRIAFAVQDRNVFMGSNGYGQPAQQNNRWVFGGFEYSGHLQPLTIASLNGYAGLQTADTMSVVTNRDRVVVTPAITVSDNFLPFLNPKPEANGQVDQAKLDKARGSSVVLQNPLKYTTKNADCVSCHMAKDVSQGLTNDSTYKSMTFRLDHTDDRIGNFRQFGYELQTNPVISARVVNETAVVLDYLNKNVAMH